MFELGSRDGGCGAARRYCKPPPPVSARACLSRSSPGTAAPGGVSVPSLPLPRPPPNGSAKSTAAPSHSNGRDEAAAASSHLSEAAPTPPVAPVPAMPEEEPPRPLRAYSPGRASGFPALHFAPGRSQSTTAAQRHRADQPLGGDVNCHTPQGGARARRGFAAVLLLARLPAHGHNSKRSGLAGRPAAPRRSAPEEALIGPPRLGRRRRAWRACAGLP